MNRGCGEIPAPGLSRIDMDVNGSIMDARMRLFGSLLCLSLICAVQ
jgi:hypothetical protein